MERLPRTLTRAGAPGTATIIRGLHSEAPEGFQGSFGGYYAFSRVPARPNPQHEFQTGVRKYSIGRAPELHTFAIASLARAAAARYSCAMNTSLFDHTSVRPPIRIEGSEIGAVSGGAYRCVELVPGNHVAEVRSGKPVR